ncbi:hypothetical protein Ssi03_24720 [Sphaerisporangium siamense]|uniref:DNA-directed RNA polymerase specialized sigma24 family protein n=1 Tax=Sphaerisporangium siamense TaxID=795645 RepID=A0A7W7D6F0_9ACTN|nr:sigma-70 family RNA polymerase sigma factor [Sphaerisporangium siamense]MBB4700205.1 DNA-directed RNA polymerase specialized sigma24 family protein [Sphaerisporangium siamense]GII84482.1 hypothetical protein Ssi03_24720 [Sphaerisporangium siamense]
MNDRDLVEALRARDPGALAALYDTYADDLYAYASAMLGSPDSAQVTLRDTLIAAEAHIETLSDPARLRPWLYALAHGECLRRRAVPPDFSAQDTAESAAVPGGDLRRVAVGAVGALPDDEREVLELLVRHSIAESDLAAVLGVPPARADELRDAARTRLQDLVTVEILTSGTAQDCPDRTRVLADGPDEEVRERLVEHAVHCPICGPYRERQVSVAKVFSLLPRPVLPETLRVRVMSCFIDPELVPYRKFVARRTGLLDGDGFPVSETKGDGRRPRLLAGAVAAVAMAVAALVLVSALSRGEGLSQTAYGVLPASSPAEATARITTAGGTPPRTAPPDPTPTGPVREHVPAITLPVVARPDARVPVRPATPPGSAVRTSRPAPAPRTPSPRPAPTAPTPSPPVHTTPPGPTPAPTATAPPTSPQPTAAPTVPPPTGHRPRPPRRRPPDRPAPTAGHQHRPAPTPCRRTPPPAATPPAQSSSTTAPAPRPPGKGERPWPEGRGRGGEARAGR